MYMVLLSTFFCICNHHTKCTRVLIVELLMWPSRVEQNEILFSRRMRSPQINGRMGVTLPKSNRHIVNFYTHEEIRGQHSVCCYFLDYRRWYKKNTRMLAV